MALALALSLVACMDYHLDAQEQDPGVAYDTAAGPQDSSPLAPGDTSEPEATATYVHDPADTEPPASDTPEAGCADGTREGYQSWDDYPDIAACSGAWTEPGVTLAAPAPTCDRGTGNDSWNPEGDGCSAEDVCMVGWHVCDGADEVADLAGSCADAVPPGTPDKALFFAVAQSSVEGTVCATAGAGDNDVFGCGNLGTSLGSDKLCGVLDRALASTHPDACGFNEAEPSLGPWECFGGDDSHYHEGALVTKKGCPGGSCSYDGATIYNWDKGGVLCCRD